MCVLTCVDFTVSSYAKEHLKGAIDSRRLQKQKESKLLYTFFYKNILIFAATIRYLEYIGIFYYRAFSWKCDKKSDYIYNCSFFDIVWSHSFKEFFKRNNNFFWHEINLSLGIILN